MLGVQESPNTVQGPNGENYTFRDALTVALAELAKASPGGGTDLAPVIAKLEALGKHLGVGNA